MLKGDYHRKRLAQLAIAPLEYDYMETLVKTYIIRGRQNQFIQDKIFNNAPVRRMAIAMNLNSAFYWFLCREPSLVSTGWSERC